MAIPILSLLLMCVVYKLNAFFSPEEVIPDDLSWLPKPSPSIVKAAIIVFLLFIITFSILGYIIYHQN